MDERVRELFEKEMVFSKLAEYPTVIVISDGDRTLPFVFFDGWVLQMRHFVALATATVNKTFYDKTKVWVEDYVEKMMRMCKQSVTIRDFDETFLEYFKKVIHDSNSLTNEERSQRVINILLDLDTLYKDRSKQPIKVGSLAWAE